MVLALVHADIDVEDPNVDGSGGYGNGVEDVKEPESSCSSHVVVTASLKRNRVSLIP